MNFFQAFFNFIFVGRLVAVEADNEVGILFQEIAMKTRKANSLLSGALGGSIAAILVATPAVVRANTITFSDTFSGAAGSSASYGGTPNTIGNRWVIPSSSQTSTWQITDTPFSGGALYASQNGSFGSNIPAPMVNPSVETPTTGFTITVDVATPIAAMTGDYPGVVFDYQNADNYDYVRVITASTGGGAIQMFNVVNGTSHFLSNSSTALPNVLAVNTMYQFTVTGSGSAFSFSLSTIGSTPTTLATATAESSQFTGGIGGIAETGNDYYSNFSDGYAPVPEPSTLGMAVAGVSGLLLAKRRRA